MHQVVKMNVDEQKAMYRKVKKEKLIEMLISANAHIDLVSRPIVVYPESTKIRPSLPILPPNRLISNNGKRVIPNVPKEDRTGNLDDIYNNNKDNSINYVLIFSIGIIFGLIIGFFYWFK